MRLKTQNLLLFTRTMGLGGTENVVLQLCEILKPQVNKLVVCSCGGVNTEKLSQMGIVHYEIPDIEQKHPKTMLKIAKALKMIVKSEQITAIHTHHRMAAFYVWLLQLHRNRLFVNTCHNTFEDKRKLTQLAYRHAELVACGEKVKQNLVDYFGLPETQVTVIHNAVKPFEGERVEDKTIAALKREGAFVVANVGRLSEQKGMAYYLESIQSVLKSIPNARFLVIGSGEDDEKLREMAKKLEIEPYVHFMGYRTDVQNLLSQVDLVVLSSLWEGLPLTPIEAFSVGKTIVATAVDGTPEIVIDGKNGLLVPPRDSRALAEKIIYMIEHPEERGTMEKDALDTFGRDFSFARFAERYSDYYKEKLNERA